MDFTCDVGDGYTRWNRGMPKPQSHFVHVREDVCVYVVGTIMRFVSVPVDRGPNRNRLEVLRTFKHGFDGVSAMEGDSIKEVYAIAEKSMNPKVYVCKIEKKKEHWHQKIVAKLTGIQATEIRAMRFNKKEIIVLLTGYPAFSLSIWRWTTEQELIMALCNEPSEFSDLLISPLNDCHWVEYGRQHMTFYDLQSFTKNDVVRTQIYLPQRFITFEKPDPAMGKPLAMSIVSACFTNFGDFYVLDSYLGLHILNQEDKVLTWLCSIGYGFLGTSITRIVPYGDCFAEVHNDGWILAYDIVGNGMLKVKRSFKLTSGILKYIQFPGTPDSFLVITEKEGLIEGVENGTLIEPFCIPDFLFSNIRTATFIEPRADYCAVLSDVGRITILDSDSGDIIENWKLPFRVASLQSHPILPFLFCGTAYGCVNVLDIQNLKRPKLISKAFLSKEKDSLFTKMTMACQGRYLIAADTGNDKVYLMYGYPFEEFEYLDSVRVPGDIRYLNVPGCGAEDTRLQVMVYAKNKVEELCPNYIYNYSLVNERLNLLGAQAIENPVKAICFPPMKSFLYTYHVDKKQIGITPFCDDNAFPVLQEPEIMVNGSFEMDLNKMFVQGDKLYTFGEDGNVSVYETPLYETPLDTENESTESLNLKLVLSVHTHTFLDKGVADGVVSLDGSQIIAIGFDGTFTRIRLMEKPKEPNWNVLGFLKPKLFEYQMTSYKRDQDRLISGRKPRNRLEMIRVQMDNAPPSVEDEELHAMISVQQSESMNLGVAKKKKKKGRKSKKGIGKGGVSEEDEEEWLCDEWTSDEEAEDGGEHHCANWTSTSQSEKTPSDGQEKEKKRRRSQIRRELEIEAEKLREEAQAQSQARDGGDDAITDEDIKILMKPKLSITETEPKDDIEVQTRKMLAKAEKKARRKTMKSKKLYKNVKSKVGEQMKGTQQRKVTDPGNEKDENHAFGGGVHSETAQNPFDQINARVEGDETEDDETEDDGDSSAGTSIVGKYRQEKLKKLKNTEEEDDDLLDERFQKGTDFFETTESVNIIQFSRPEKETKGIIKMYEGVDPEGIFCVNFNIQNGEIPAPENWSRYEYTLLYRQFQPRSQKLQNVLNKMMELFATVMKVNSSRDARFQVSITEFNLDDDIEAILQDKGNNYAKYCHIQMMARNKLRHIRIDKFKNMLWDSYTHKGKLFLGYDSPIVITNYPLKSREIIFGTSVEQCQEERRLELKIESSEDEFVELGNHYTFNIIKSEMEHVEPEAQKLYMKSMMSMDLGVKYDDFNESEDDEEELKTVLQELGLTQGGRPKKDGKGLTPSEQSIGILPKLSKQKESISAFGSRLPTKPREHRSQESMPRLSAQSKHRKKKKEIRTRPPSVARLRMQQRQRRIESEMVIPEEQSELADEKVEDGKLQKKRLVHIGFAMSDYSGAEDTTDDSADDGESIASSVALSKKDILDTIKPSKTYIPARGIFGPKGAVTRHRSKMDTLLRTSHGHKKRRTKKKEKSSDPSSSRQKRLSKKLNIVKEFVVLSEDENEGDEEEEWEGVDDEVAFIELKNAKFSAMDEDQITPYYNIQRIFAGSLKHEMEDMYEKWRPNPYQYHQMELKARHQFVRQIWLATDEVYRLKLFFDELFEETASYKIEVLERMKERNERIREIYYYLNLDLDILDDVNDPKEDPGRIFTVSKEEILVEKYYTAEQKEQQRLEAEEAERLREELEAMQRWELEEEEEAELEREEQLAMLAAEEAEMEEEASGEGEGSEEGGFEEGGSEEGLEEGSAEDEKDSEEAAGEEEEECVGGSEGSEEVCGSEEAEGEEHQEEEEEEPYPLQYLLLPGERKEDIILKQIPKPAFMMEKGMMEYSLEEFVTAREYRDECEVLEKERTRMMRSLQHELHTLYKANANDYNSIDLRLKELLMGKIQLHYNILMEECTISRLVRLMRTTDDCQKEEDRVTFMLQKLQEEMKSTQMLVSQLTIKKSECKEQEMVIQERENDLERRFRKDLGDVGHYLAFFMKELKRKPKIQGKGMDKAEVYEMGIRALKSTNLRAFGRENGEAARSVVMAIMDLEDPMLMPSGCPRTHWDKFCKLRRKRLICDFEIKFALLEMEHITKGLQECSEREDMTAKTMAAVLAILSHRTEMRNYIIYNTEFQFITGKGNVEINFWDVGEHENSVMTLANNIEKLNARVAVATERYIRDTKRCIFVHRDVREIEWKFKVEHRTRQDLKHQLYDVNNTRPNKELLRALRLGIDLTTIHNDRILRVKNLIEAADKHQQTFIASRNKLKEMYQRQMKRQQKANDKLKEWLEVENRATSLMKHSSVSVTPEQRAEKYNERVSKFLAKGYMIRQIHDNYQTIGFLETELARYYQKSFPCL